MFKNSLITIFALSLIYSAPGSAYEVVAHRGASGDAPENTMAAIKAAESQGADYLEIDIHLTRDNQIVVIHDRKVNRTTNGVGKVRELTLEQIKSLDAGSWFSGEFAEEKIPTLAEVFEQIEKDSKVIIEFKFGHDKYPDIEKKVIKLIRDYKLTERVILKSFDTTILNTFEVLAPELPRLYVLIGTFGNITIDNTLRFRSMLAVSNVDIYQIHKCFLTKKIVQKVHAKGKKIIAWGVRPEDKDEMVELGVDMIEVDFPNLFN